MRTPIEWAEVHAPLFLGGSKGVNLGNKLDPSKRQGLKLFFDEAKRHLFVELEGRAIRVPEASVLSMIELAPVVRAVVGSDIDAKYAEGVTISEPIVAQVSTPQSHVFAGPGGGMTGQEETLPKRGPGRPKKA